MKFILSLSLLVLTLLFIGCTTTETKETSSTKDVELTEGQQLALIQKNKELERAKQEQIIKDLEKGFDLYNKHDYANALDTFNLIEKQEPNNIRMLVGKIFAYQAFGVKDKAKEYGQKLYTILNEKPIDKTIYYHEAGDAIAWGAEMPKEGIEMYTIQIQLTNFIDSWHHRGWHLWNIGEKEKGKEDLLHAIEMAKNSNNPNLVAWEKEFTELGF